jgi:DNA primase catalytic core
VPIEDAATVAPNAPLGFALQHVDAHHPYLAARGLAAETIRTFGVGFYRGSGFLRGRIVIPIHDERGALIAYAGRTIGDQKPKYRFPMGFRKSLVLFNLHRVLKTGGRTVIVVEGFFDAIAVHQGGYPAVVALMGSTLSRHQADLLCTHFDRVLLMLDGDAAGRHGATAVADALTARIRLTPITLDDGCQPDHLSADVLRQRVGAHLHA